ncbi:MAG: ABC transporter substrate-binding protein [Rhodoferax sp.]|nr:ABC transporter substrate-binding protein [Rhodoferax sp.]
MPRALQTGVCVGLCFLLCACNPPPPIKLGFLGGLSGKFSDLGISTRNGALLAIETTNAAGGIGGRQLSLLEMDDKQNPEAALQAMAEFERQEVVAVIGPSTSSIAVAVTPVANAKRMLLVAPTATTNALSGKDDYFFRAVGDAAFYGVAAAKHHYAMGLRHAALVLDLANADYTESWATPYAKTFTALGGSIDRVEHFTSTQKPDYQALARRLVLGQPDLVITVASSADSALIAQRVRALAPNVRLAGAGWASTERLIELGGASVEGMLFEQYFDRFDPSPKFQSFLKAYQARFRSDPGFGAVLAHDATHMVIAGLRREHGAKDLKAAVLAVGHFEGAQNPVRLDANGDVSREVYFGVVKNGTFARYE